MKTLLLVVAVALLAGCGARTVSVPSITVTVAATIDMHAYADADVITDHLKTMAFRSVESDFAPTMIGLMQGCATPAAVWIVQAQATLPDGEGVASPTVTGEAPDGADAVEVSGLLAEQGAAPRFQVDAYGATTDVPVVGYALRSDFGAGSVVETRTVTLGMQQIVVDDCNFGPPVY